MNESLLCVFSAFRLFKKPLQVPSGAAEKTRKHETRIFPWAAHHVWAGRGGEDAGTEKLGD